MQLAVPVRVAPADVCGQRLARQVVWKQPFPAGVDERQSAQPAEQLVHVGHVQHLGEQSFGRGPHQRAHLQRRAMRGPRHLLHKLVEQDADDVRLGRGLEMYLRALVENIGHQRQRQRMPVRKVEHHRMLRRRNGAPREEVTAFLRAEIAQR